MPSLNTEMEKRMVFTKANFTSVKLRKQLRPETILNYPSRTPFPSPTPTGVKNNFSKPRAAFVSIPKIC